MVLAGKGSLGSSTYGANTTFTMSGGYIESNLASLNNDAAPNPYGGGGVFLSGNSPITSTFTMSAGTVQNNKSNSTKTMGSGVFSLGAVTKIINGSVINNVPIQVNGVDSQYN